MRIVASANAAAQRVHVIALFAILTGLAAALTAPADANDVTVAFVQQRNNGDIIFAHGNSLTVTVVNINPIIYKNLMLQETYTTQPAPAYTIPTTLSGSTGSSNFAAFAQLMAADKSHLFAKLRRLSALVPDATPVKYDCTTPDKCLNTLSEIQSAGGVQSQLLTQYTLWNDYLSGLEAGIVQAANDYATAQVAGANSLSPIALAASDNNCMNEAKAVATWLISPSVPPAPALPPTSTCPGSRPTPDSTSDLTTFFLSVSNYELVLNNLRNQIASNIIRFTAATNPLVVAGVNDAATLTTRLAPGGNVDMSQYAQSGTSGAALALKAQAIEPFVDYNLASATQSLDIACSPYRVIGKNHAVIVTGQSRIPTGSVFSQANPNVPTTGINSLPRQIATVECPGAFAVSAGGGVTFLKQTSYQVVQPNPTASPAVGNLVPVTSNDQLYAAAFAHYQLAALGDSPNGLFVTVGIGTSPSSFAGFYGLSIGLNRFFFVNALMDFASTTVVVPGAITNGNVPATYSPPTAPGHETKFSLGISFGTPLSTVPATPGAPSSTGP